MASCKCGYQFFTGEDVHAKDCPISELRSKLESAQGEIADLKAIVDHVHYCPSKDHVSPAAVECEKSDKLLELLAYSQLARARMELQLGEAKKLLAQIEEQGLHHDCAMEGYLEKLGCDECKAGTEQKILEFIGAKVEPLVEKRVEETSAIWCTCVPEKDGAHQSDCAGNS